MIEISSKIKDYYVDFIDQNYFTDFHDFDLFVIDEKVFALHANLLNKLDMDKVFLVEAREANKTLDFATVLLETIVARGLNKKSKIAAIGGGIIQDLTGFVANIYYRGIHWEYFPTTLLSIGDSCIGGKTSINFQASKNLLGTFYPPEKVNLYLPFVQTLDKNDYLSGMAEILKINLVNAQEECSQIVERCKTASFENSSLLKLVKETLMIKRDIIQEDEFDTGRRNQLNFGHCIGHALESVSNFNVQHGLAIHVGMRLSVPIAEHLGLISGDKAVYLTRCLDDFAIVERALKYLEPSQIIQLMLKDKKRVMDGLTIICPLEDGGVEIIHDVDPSIIKPIILEYKRAFTA